MAVLKVCYKQGVRFDEAYYVGTHLPLAGDIMGPHGITSVEVIRVTSAADGSAAPYQVIFTAHFQSETSLRNALNDPRMAEAVNDIRNFYDGMPDFLVGEVIPLPALSA
ncbi:MAG TPA: EthD family reductase [Acidobacteriaceae bacterium]